LGVHRHHHLSLFSPFPQLVVIVLFFSFFSNLLTLHRPPQICVLCSAVSSVFPPFFLRCRCPAFFFSFIFLVGSLIVGNFFHSQREGPSPLFMPVFRSTIANPFPIESFSFSLSLVHYSLTREAFLNPSFSSWEFFFPSFFFFFTASFRRQPLCFFPVPTIVPVCLLSPPFAAISVLPYLGRKLFNCSPQSTSFSFPRFFPRARYLVTAITGRCRQWIVFFCSRSSRKNISLLFPSPSFGSRTRRIRLLLTIFSGRKVHIPPFFSPLFFPPLFFFYSFFLLPG